MAKEDLFLREEMGRLEIEPMKVVRSKRDENPFVSQSKRGPFMKTSVSNVRCCCGEQRKVRKDGICKKKHNKILKEPVLQILKTCANSLEKDKYQANCDSNFHSVSMDTLNLCTLVKNCNDLKISTDSKNCGNNKEINEGTRWWKCDLSNLRESREPKQHSQTGSCSQQALNPPCDVTIDELASYFETLVHIPKKMSSMAEMMYI